MSIWQLRDIQKFYTKNARPVLCDINLMVEAGEKVGIIGPSGAGKSTLASVGLGLTSRNSGQVSLFGQNTDNWGKSEWRAARKSVQILHQDPAASLDPYLTVSQFLQEAYALHASDLDPTHVTQTLHSLGLKHVGKRRPHQLSGGERRRVGIAKLMMASPRLVVADELTAGLDAARKLDTVAALQTALPSSCALVLISHDVQLVTSFTDRIYSMNEGRIVECFQSSQAPTHPITVALFRAAGIQ
jgi:ABC-type dipeptide/oligopeptide/nickel transport system ATPase subunit